MLTMLSLLRPELVKITHLSHQQACQWTPARAEEVFRVKLFSDTRSGEACYNVCQPLHTQFIWKFLWKEYIGNFLFTHEA